MHNLMRVEVTDTFGGEANYSWVQRYKLPFNEDASDYQLVRAAKRAAGYNGIDCKKEQQGECIALYPRGQCVVIFITFETVNEESQT